MSAKQVWVSPFGGDWKIHSAGAGRAAAIVDDKAEAFELAREIAINKGAELIVQNLDGKIGLKNSYGKDYCPPQG
ncbi:MAG: DUF2188 domain-containing protein [Candidatus Taylorbacteria bacterium]|nr:DUF2188 domain-containing protein [Candidatus Taylorbacteria bacterium]